VKQWISCNACGADRFESLNSVGEWTIGRCGACGLIYVNPVPFFAPTSDFSRLSREFEYTRYMHQPVTEAIGGFERAQLAFDLEQIARLKGRRPEWESHVRSLEIGCGSGASVRAAADLGWSAIGIDIDPELIGEGRERLGVDLRCTPLLDSGLPDGAFDFIRLRDVIEHLPDPYESLMKVRSLLAPDGIALIVTPNEAGLVTRARLATGRKRTLVATVAPPHHLHGFGPRTLRRICGRAGLKVYDVSTTTPVDARYVTSNNMRSSGRKGVNAIWSLGGVLGMGAMLVAWTGP
jgi:2-polyprenyl-3-methyl-5-hydroxy-6-metoxy-1,4-benzoquinol methylase